MNNIFKKILINGDITHWSVNEEGRVRNDENGKFLKGTIEGFYCYMSFRWKRKKYKKVLQEIVAEAFLDNPYNYTYVFHIDGNTLNNCVTNLKWIAHSEEEELNIFLKKDEHEIWKNYQNSFYQVSNFGNMRDTKRNKELKFILENNGSYSVLLQLPCQKRKKFLVHEIVYSTFISSVFNEVQHLNGVRTDNRVSNLIGS